MGGGSGLRGFLAAGVLLVLIFSADAEPAPWQGFTALALSADGAFFAAGGRRGEVQWRETSTGEVLGRWAEAEGVPVVALLFDRGRLAWVGADGVFLTTTLGEKPAVLKSSDPLVPALSAAADRWVTQMPLLRGVAGTQDGWGLRGGADGTIAVTPPGSATVSWVGHQAAVTGVVLVPDHSLLVSSSVDGTLRLWNPATGQLLGGL